MRLPKLMMTFVNVTPRCKWISFIEIYRDWCFDDSNTIAVKWFHIVSEISMPGVQPLHEPMLTNGKFDFKEPTQSIVNTCWH